MKKLSIFLLGALGMMAATSCEEKIDPALPQANPQEPILTSGDVVSEATGVLASSAVLNLEDYRAEGSVIPVMKLVETKDLPEGAAVGYKLQISNTEDFKRNITLDATVGQDNVYSVDAAAWNEAHLTLFGKSPKVKKTYYRVPVYVNLDGSDYRLNSADFYAVQGTIDETCMDAGFVIYDNYYLLGSNATWNLTQADVDPFKFTHSDADVYDDPVFTIGFKVTQEVLDANGGGCYIKVASQRAIDEASWDYVYGAETDGDENLEGILVEGGSCGAIKLLDAGNYKMTINMEEMTYEIQMLTRPEYLYTPGGFNGWSQDASAWMQYDVKNSPSKGYYGFFGVDGAGFKVCTEPSWDNNVTFGAETETPALTGTFVMGEAGKNIMVPEAGMFWASVQYDEALGLPESYTLTPVTRVGVIGSFAASGWGSDIEMTSADGGITWTAEITLKAGDEWKIRFNNEWTYSLGADPDNENHAVLDGNNYKAAEAGTFVVTLTTQPGIPVIKLTAK